MRLRAIFLVGVPLALIAAAPFGYSLTRKGLDPKLAKAEIEDKRKSGERLCAARIVNDRLKAQLFEEAAAVGGGASANLDLLASFSEVRMDHPVLKDQDSELGVTVCQGRFAVLLPPGSERGFGGMRVLRADVEYAAQPAADGSGLVYQLKGAESIVYRIAAFSLRNHTIVPNASQLAKAEPLPDMPLAVEPKVWPAPAKVEEEAPALPATAPAPATHVRLAKAAKPEVPKQAAPVKIARLEPQKVEKPVAVETKPKPVVQLAKAEPKPKKESVRVAVKVEPKKAPVRLAVKAEPKPKKVEPKAKRIELAAVKKAPATTGKNKPKRAEAPAKPKEAPTRLAAAKPSTKPAASTPVKKQASNQLAQKKPAVVEKPRVQLASTAPKKPTVVAKPKVQLAAAEPKKTAEPPRDLSANSFQAYEDARQRKATTTAPEPVRNPIVQRASAPAPRNDCNSAGGIEARLVCANPGLAPKQRAANNFYYAALEQAGQQARRELTGSRNRFLAYLDRCRSAACASAAYDDRMAEIRDIMREF